MLSLKEMLYELNIVKQSYFTDFFPLVLAPMLCEQKENSVLIYGYMQFSVDIHAILKLYIHILLCWRKCVPFIDNIVQDAYQKV